MKAHPIEIHKKMRAAAQAVYGLGHTRLGRCAAEIVLTTGRLFNDPDNCQGIQDARDADREKSVTPTKVLGNPTARSEAQQHADVDTHAVEGERGTAVAEGKVVADHGVRRR